MNSNPLADRHEAILTHALTQPFIDLCDGMADIVEAISDETDRERARRALKRLRDSPDHAAVIRLIRADVDRAIAGLEP